MSVCIWIGLHIAFKNRYWNCVANIRLERESSINVKTKLLHCLYTNYNNFVCACTNRCTRK